MNKTYILFNYNVADISIWKPIYDGREAKRTQHGLKELYILKNHENPNKITILFEAEDLVKAKAFVASDDLVHDMKRAGVSGPEISILTSTT